jgi:hypothetical protein
MSNPFMGVVLLLSLSLKKLYLYVAYTDDSLGEFFAGWLVFKL